MRRASLVAAAALIGCTGGAHSDNTSGSLRHSLAPRPAEILAQRPLAVTDESRFLPTLFSPTTVPPSSAAEPAEATVRADLERRLRERGGDNAVAEHVLATFDDPVARRKIPSATLRAAVASLLDTPAQAAVEEILRGVDDHGAPLWLGVVFDDGGIVPATSVATVHARRIVFNGDLRSEDPFVIGPVVAHEALHHDRRVDGWEEAAAHAIDEVVALHQLARHPTLARGATWLTRYRNTRALARLNSGVGTHLGLFATNGGAPLVPGQTQAPRSWWETLAVSSRPGEATPGHALLARYLAAMGITGQECGGDSFDEELLSCLDGVDGGLTAIDLAAAARALGLDPDD